MIETIFADIQFWHWFALAVILIILDVAVGAHFLFLWCGLAAGLVGLLLLAIPTMSWEYQLLIFGLGVMSSIAFWFFYLRKQKTVTDQPNLNERSRQYIGRTFTLVEAIENGRGKIRVGDTIWRVQGPEMPEGQKVIVVDADGVILIVERVE